MSRRLRCSAIAAGLCTAVTAILVCSTDFCLAQATGSHRQRAARSVNNTVCALYNSSCGKCIAVGCHWCARGDDFDASESRCGTRGALRKNDRCPTHQIIASNTSVTYHNRTEPRGPTADRPAVQLSPQNLTIHVRPNFPTSFQVTFRQAENYPVDLYFLMDVSMTMDKFRKTLVNMSEQLTRELRNLTSDYRIGIGTFVDKPTMPFCNRRQLSRSYGESPYIFRNQLNLTSDVELFRRQVNETLSSGNLDRPEGQFDALMQAIVCSREIGWRNESRKLIVISTDEDYHMAGDGLLGGIIEPNDERCHTDSTGDYPNRLATRTDYPSISQIARKIADMKINVIWAIPKNKTVVSRSYVELCRHMEGCSVAPLDADCRNIVQLIRTNYKNISSTVRLKVKPVAGWHRFGKTGSENREPVRVSFRSNCSGREIETSTCRGIEIGVSVLFNVSVEIPTAGGLCPEDRDRWTQRIVIYPAGLADTLSVEVKLDCECPCERPEATEAASPRCRSRGSLRCGACACDAGFAGQQCECPTDENLCREPSRNASSGPSGPVCSGRGRCACGRCECDAISGAEPTRLFTGRLCECNDFSCEYYNGRLCGGPDRGVCRCGKCDCDKDRWTGDRCDCSTSTDGCTATRNGRPPCNGAGTCVCNECRCNPRSIYRGAKCEECPTCSDKCDEYAECVRCKLAKGSNDSACADIGCPDVRLILSGSALPVARDDRPHLKSCTARLDDRCRAVFTYDHASDELTVLRQPVCEKPTTTVVPIWLIVGLSAGILSLGVVLLAVWKIYVTVHDRREYATFENECKNARFAMEDNPVYKTAIKKSNNPLTASSQ